jgi:hypothetical protein
MPQRTGNEDLVKSLGGAGYPLDFGANHLTQPIRLQSPRTHPSPVGIGRPLTATSREGAPATRSLTA